MRILFLDSWLRDRAAGSGTTVAIAGLARGLEALGHEVEVLAPRRRLFSLDLTRLAFNLGLPRRLEGRAEAADLIVGFDADGCCVGAGIRSRYVVALKGVAADERAFERGWSGVRFDVLRRLEGRNARCADRVFVTSDYAARAATTAYGLDARRVRVVPEGLDAEVLRRAGEARAEEPPIDARDPVILSVARQYRRKDTPTMLRAFRRICQRVPGARLRIVGDGPELESSRRLAARLGLAARVAFTGALPSVAALDAEYRRARIFCLPSRQEGFGIVFLEAMAYGLPIAAARAAAVPEVAPEGRTSLLVPPGDDAALADALARLLEDSAFARRLGAAGPPRARNFDWRSVAAAFIDGL